MSHVVTFIWLEDNEWTYTLHASLITLTLLTNIVQCCHSFWPSISLLCCSPCHYYAYSHSSSSSLSPHSLSYCMPSLSLRLLSSLPYLFSCKFTSHCMLHAACPWILIYTCFVSFIHNFLSLETSPFLFLLYIAISGNEECWEHTGTDNGTLEHGKDLRNTGQCHQSYRVTTKGEENPELACWLL